MRWADISRDLFSYKDIQNGVESENDIPENDPNNVQTSWALSKNVTHFR